LKVDYWLAGKAERKIAVKSVKLSPALNPFRRGWCIWRRIL